MAQYLDKVGLTTLWTKIKNTFALKKHTHKKSEITDLTIPTVNNPTITINQGGVKKGSFSLNQSGAATIDLTDDNTTYSAVTQSANGLMSAADKKKLDGIDEGANKITVDSSLSSTSTNPVQNKVIKGALDGKAASSHTHPIDKISGLQDALDGKQAKGNYVTTDTAQIITGDKTFNTIRTNSNIIVDDTNNDTHTYYQDKKILYISYDSDGDIVEDYTYTLPNKTGVLATTDDLNNITVDSSLSSTSTNPVQNKVIKSALDGKAGSNHDHDNRYYTESEIDTKLNKKSDSGHNHSYLMNSSGRQFNVPTGGSGGEQKTLVITDDLNAYQPAGNYASSTHKHPISDINNLQSTIDGIYTDIGLQDEAIAGKADVGHTHEISNINGLQSALNGKSNLDHNHDSVYQAKGDYATNNTLKNYVTGTTFIDYTTYIEGEVNKKANASHSHDISNINGLQSALDGKLTNYNNSVSRPNGTSFTFPNGTNPVQMRSGATSGADLGIFRLSDDNAFICNSSDIGYAFAVFDTDKTSDFSTASNAAFAVLSDHSGVSIKGGLSVDGKAVSLDGHTHSYLPLSGGTIDAGGSKAPLILKGGVGGFREGLRIIPPNNWSTILLGGNDVTESEGTSPNSWAILNNDGRLYISKNGDASASTKLSNTDGTWRVNDNTIIHSGNIGSQNVNYATSAGDADTLDGNHASAFARIAADNNLLYHTDEFTFASSGFSGAIWLNYRTAGGTNGNITEYKLGNGAGGALGTIIHSGNIGSQSVNYANSAGSANSVAWGNVSGRPTSLPASNISMSSDGTTLTITYS